MDLVVQHDGTHAARGEDFYGVKPIKGQLIALLLVVMVDVRMRAGQGRWTESSEGVKGCLPE
jgi:hypothetical protein